MASAALQRLESLLQTRKLARTLTSTRPEAGALARRRSTGIASLDAALGGGWRQGEISEVVGVRSSGRTSVIIATLAAATRQGGVVALVDAFDRFDPVAAARAGVDLSRLLWVRGAALTLEGGRPQAAGGGRERSAGAVLRAIRALDLIVRAGGFAVAALDLVDVPARYVRGLPFTTWMRLAHANEGRDTVCLLAGDDPMGKSARGVSIRLATSKRWTGASAQARRFAGFEVRAQVVAARMDGDLHPCWVLDAAC